MKKWGLICFVIVFIFIVVGCSNNQVNNEPNENEQNDGDMENEDNNELVEVDENNNNDDLEVDQNNADNEGNQGNEEEEVIEVVDPLYEMSGASVVPIDDAPANIVLLTIDDAFLSTNNDYSVEMAQILTELDAGAIFFVNGQRLQSEEDRAKLLEIYNMGFEIGNHSMTHPNFSQISEEQQRNEIVELNDIIEEITGERPRFFRAPFGVNTDTSKAIVEEEEMQWMNWSYGYDWEQGYMEAEPLAEIMVETPYLRDGANLLMHDRHFTRDALRDIVIGLREKGFEIVNPGLIK
ncbi:polysaccharide deacetylase family protein [Evansella sp. AB-rgal1]|uniref:polysaccharide deacetylase family protein n=1 Tax=Evansella sp. AB-rgal1 TaxID=3242696 RepID=UPI00359DAAB6